MRQRADDAEPGAHAKTPARDRARGHARRSRLERRHQRGAMNLFKTVRPNIVQSIRAFRVPELAQAAADLGQHFLYANCAHCASKAEILETIATSFTFPKHFGKNFDALADCLTDMIYKAGPQPGFVIVLEGLPIAQKFDKEAREVLLDVFRDAAEFWGERKVQFRVFYSFA
ncbi:barstar family protein [Cupriavidus neocaledonicus]|uniref:barstar family protein n=1 Tax=Cupriavidus neocaledonicus TaxID=1040979 RepID=UPI003B849B5B